MAASAAAICGRVINVLQKGREDVIDKIPKSVGTSQSHLRRRREGDIEDVVRFFRDRREVTFSSSPRVAIVSDPLVQRGGAERVVEALADAFPDAPVYALLYSETTGPKSLRSRVRTSWLQRVPQAARRHRAFFPFFPAAIESFDLSAYDIVISSHHTAAKGLLRGADQLHVCYCHTPMRALWERSAAELQTLPLLARPFAGAVFRSVRVWDYATAARVDRFIANSRVTQMRIQRHYGRESTVLAPPIDVERFTPGPGATSYGDYYLVASRPVPYKRVDIAIAATRAAGRRLVIVGGTHKRVAVDSDVIALGIVDDATLLNLMRGARALLFPQYEDFGMTPLEMNACGRPVIAFAAGGALDTVIDGATGLHVAEQSVAAFALAISRFETMRFDSAAIRAHAESFSKENFIRRLRDEVAAAWHARGNVSRNRENELHTRVLE